MNGTKVKGYVEAGVVALWAVLIVYCQVTGTPIEGDVLKLLAAIILGYFGFAAIEHIRREG